MSVDRRYFLVRLEEQDSERFLLLPDYFPKDILVDRARRHLHLGADFLNAFPAERDRLALVLRDFAHLVAAQLVREHPQLNLVGVDTLQSAFLGREVRESAANLLTPVLAGSLIAEVDAAIPQKRVLKLENLWRQALGQRGSTKLALRTLLTLHQRGIAAILAERLDLNWRPQFPSGDDTTAFPVPLDQFASHPQYLYVMNNIPYHAMREALAMRSFTVSEDSPWPTAVIKRGNTQGQAQLFPVEMEVNPYREPTEQQELVDRMWRQVSDLNDLDADVLDMMSALWIQQARDHNDFARINVKQLLELRGLKPKTGEGGRASGFRPEQKQQLFQAIQHISSLFLLIYDMEVPRADGKGRERREVRSRAFVITDVMGNRPSGGMNMDIEEFLIRPGVLFGHYLFGPGRQLALLSSKAIQYDRIRQEWEKRLARYFSWIWRNDASNDRPIRNFLVRTLLEAAGKTVDEDHPKRTRDRLERALTQLQLDQVIAAWEWDRERGAEFREPRNWQDYWLEWGVRIQMPDFVQKQYRNIGVNAQAHAQGQSQGRLALPQGRAAQSKSGEGKTLNNLNSEDLGPLLFAWRKERSRSQADMAALLGITQSYYSHLERGTRIAPADTRRRIEALLERPL